ncbi:MAG: peptidoglycan DD-metalloendopeptidase family protein [Candidatus Paceibacterota bacterium]|jgi:murein DD-endopeptidase MepM/ murein hydrolase activator NlpD
MSVVSGFLFAIMFVSPVPAHAGLFSFVSDLFSSDTVEADAKTVTVQNVALLAAVSSPDPNAARKEDITIVADSALMASVGPLGTMVDVEEFAPTSSQISTYTVRKGDTVSSIAAMFDISANTILWANGLSKSSALKEGQSLVILPVSGVRHTVKSGETVEKIAKKYGGDVNEILQYNDLTKTSKIAIGDVIIIPGGTDYISVPTTPSSKSALAKRFASQPNYPGYYIRPVNGGRLTQGLHMYNAVDVAPDCHCSGAEPIMAAASGNVIVSRIGGWNGGYGNYVVVSHSNGTQTLYAHMQRVLVSPGSYVFQGQIIGYVGSSGNSTGPHLHFEVRGAKNPLASY